MKLVVISDTHRLQDSLSLPEGDVLIHCGDLTGRGGYDEFKRVGEWFFEQSIKFKHRIFIGGNHDFGLEYNSELILSHHFDPDIIYLQDSGTTINGVNFWGTPWTPTFHNWAFMGSEIELADKFKLIPTNTHVLITHGPAHRVLDKVQEGRRVGSTALKDRISKLDALKHHVFGHIHESYGYQFVNRAPNPYYEAHNCSILNRQYQITNKPIIIEV